MAESTAPRNIQDLARFMARFFQWWKVGLRSCIPGRLYTRLIGERMRWVLDLKEDRAVARCLSEQDEEIQRLTVSEPGELQSLIQVMGQKTRPPTLSILLPEAWVLCKTVSLPAAVMKNLSQVLSYEMDRLTPFHPADIYFDYKLNSQVTGQGQVEVDLAVVQRNLLNKWIDGILQANIRLRTISTEGVWSGLDFARGITRLKTQKRANKGRRFRHILAISTLLLGIAALVSPLWQMRSVAIGLNEKVATAKRKTEAVLRLKSRIEAAESAFNYVVEQRKQSMPVIQVLDRVTRLLPDDTWVQQLDLKGDMIEIRGVSGQATRLIKLFEDDASFTDAAFRSPVVQASSNSRYHMAARLVVSGAE